MPLKGVEGLEAWLHAYLVSALDRAEGLDLHRSQFYLLGRNKSAHRTGGSVDSKTSLNILENKRKF
jgi:hypothetical protein